MQTKLSIFCDKMLEAGCLLTVVITPLFFNVSSNRAFEPDKISIVRSIALIMTVAWLIKAIDGRGQRRRVAGTNGDGGVLNQGLWQRLIRTPLILPVMLFVGSYLLSTLLSVAPRISLLGSYLRLQGTYTTFSYIIIFFLTLVTIQRQEQIDRLCNAIIFTSLPISLYGILEHYHLDPIAWGTNVTTRVTSSMGNPIFLAAYLIMVVPVTLSRIIESTTAEGKDSVPSAFLLLYRFHRRAIDLYHIYPESRSLAGPVGWVIYLYACCAYLSPEQCRRSGSPQSQRTPESNRIYRPEHPARSSAGLYRSHLTETRLALALAELDISHTRCRRFLDPL